MSLSVLALKKRDNELEKVVFELVGKAKRFYDGEINIILPVNTNTDCSKFISELEQAGCNKIYLVKNEKIGNYETITYKNAVLEAIKTINPEILLIGATNNGRDIAPRIASALQVGLTADCTELSINEDGKLAATRPTFGGSLMATILSRKNPQMATVRPKVFQRPQADIYNKAEVVELFVDIPDEQNLPEEMNFTAKTLQNSGIEDAEIIVAAGKGAKNPETLELVETFAESIGGKLAASRGLVDMGLCPNDIQVGQTGKTVTPKIYIACGISGAIQHIEGMKGSQTIIAINNDKDAPIFNVADYGIVGDLNEILPKLTEKTKGN